MWDNEFVFINIHGLSILGGKNSKNPLLNSGSIMGIQCGYEVIDVCCRISQRLSKHLRVCGGIHNFINHKSSKICEKCNSSSESIERRGRVKMSQA